jgi:curved DNA-binding protein CbpA
MADACTWISAAKPTPPDVNLQPFAQFLFSCLNQPRNLGILVESAKIDETKLEVLQQLYGLYCAGLVEFTRAASPAENPLQQALPSRKPAEKSTASPAVCTALAWPLQEDPETTRRKRLESIKRDIKKIRQLLSSASDDYAVLGLQPGATPAEVKHSYRQLVHHYHPDLHHPHSDVITLATLSEVLMAIRAAYETAIEHALLSEIISSNTRRYQAVKRGQAESASAFDPPTPPNSGQNLAEQMQNEKLTAEAIKSRNLSLAEVKHRQALAHQARGEYESAIGYMSDAVTLAPDCARYHGELAALLEKVPMRREQAEQHFLRATELEAINLFYHLQVGRF